MIVMLKRKGELSGILKKINFFAVKWFNPTAVCSSPADG